MRQPSLVMRQPSLRAGADSGLRARVVRHDQRHRYSLSGMVLPKLLAVTVERFKRIEHARVELDSLNVLVGANNSGKSSVIQGLHFAIATLQTVKQSETRWQRNAASLAPAQLIYAPTQVAEALGTGGELSAKREEGISVLFEFDDGRCCQFYVSKGRNKNIVVHVSDTELADELGSLTSPVSVFSPGLAGVAREEQFVSDGVLLRTLARGDANLILRNILLRIWNDPKVRQNFEEHFEALFPQFKIRVKFRERLDEFIAADLLVRDEAWVPLELAGTGILQAIQILAYIHRFSPRLVVLDEPDSHLHPNNQRLLCSLLLRVVEETNTNVLLTTHSRHVLDALSGAARVHWMQHGKAQTTISNDDVAILLDLGALDAVERLQNSSAPVVVLTEDEEPNALRAVLAASGFQLDQIELLPYFGVTTIKNLRPLVNIVRKVNKNAKIVLHRDRDYLQDDVVEEWKKTVRQLRIVPFVTAGVDAESYLISADHLSSLNGLDLADADELISSVRADEMHVQFYVNGRVDALRKNGEQANPGKLATEATKAVAKEPARWCHGKASGKALRREFQARHGANIKLYQPSQHIVVEELRNLASTVHWK